MRIQNHKNWIGRFYCQFEYFCNKNGKQKK